MVFFDVFLEFGSEVGSGEKLMIFVEKSNADLRKWKNNLKRHNFRISINNSVCVALRNTILIFRLNGRTIFVEKRFSNISRK